MHLCFTVKAGYLIQSVDALPGADSTILASLRSPAFLQAIKNPNIEDAGVFSIKSLTMTYSRMGKCHTTIGAG
ncbi:hypothetical protein, partial [Marinobacter xestospongiae]